jgi:hypothetical protein
MISYTWGKYANHHTNDAVYIMEYVIAVRYDLAIIEGNKYFFVI